MNLLNLTPHDVNICKTSGAPLLFLPKTGQVARVTSSQETLGPVEVYGMAPDMGGGMIHPVPVVSPPVWGEVQGIPDISGFDGIVVSMLVAQALVAKGGLVIGVYCPDTGPAAVVRDAAGRIIGTTRLVKYA